MIAGLAAVDMLFSVDTVAIVAATALERARTFWAATNGPVDAPDARSVLRERGW